MRNILVEITCKTCYYHTHIKSHTLVMADLEPTLKERILTHKMFTFHCPRCNSEIAFLHNFLYRDTNHKFFIYMSEDEKDLEELREQFPTWTLRFVRNTNDLVEKIRILEDALDDCTIEIIKYKLKKRYPSIAILRYHDCDEAHNLWFTYSYEDTYDMKGIPHNDYLDIQRLYTPYIAQNKQYEIQATWVKQVLDDTNMKGYNHE